MVMNKGQKFLCSLLAMGALCGYIAIGSRTDNNAAIAQSANPTSKPISTIATKQASASAQALASLIQETRIVYTFEYTAYAGAAYVDRTFLVLKDGTFTRDFSGVLADGVAASRQENPRRWGTWKIKETGDFVYRYRETSDWQEPIATQPSYPPAQYATQTLDDCYTSQSAISLPNVSSLSYNTFCFTPEGTFSNSSTRSTLTPEAIAGSAKDTAGYYQIDGSVITLKYGNGATARQIVGLYPAQISINGKIFSKGG